MAKGGGGGSWLVGWLGGGGLNLRLPRGLRTDSSRGGPFFVFKIYFHMIHHLKGYIFLYPLM